MCKLLVSSVIRQKSVQCGPTKCGETSNHFENWIAENDECLNVYLVYVHVMSCACQCSMLTRMCVCVCVCGCSLTKGPYLIYCRACGKALNVI